IQSEHDVEVLAQTSQKAQLIAQSDVSKPKPDKDSKIGKANSAVALSLDLGMYTNNVLATITGVSVIDAKENFNVAASLSYPFLIRPADIILGIPQDIVDRGASAVTDLLDGTLGVGSKFLTTWVMSRAKAAETQAVAISGSIGLNFYTDTAKAIIQSGARINQMVPSASWHPGADQSVSGTAETTMQFAEMAGIGKWSFSDSPFGKLAAEGKEKMTFGDVFDFFSRSGSKVLGGSLLMSD